MGVFNQTMPIELTIWCKKCSDWGQQWEKRLSTCTKSCPRCKWRRVGRGREWEESHLPCTEITSWWDSHHHVGRWSSPSVKMLITTWENGHHHVGRWSSPRDEMIITTWEDGHHHVWRWSSPRDEMVVTTWEDGHYHLVKCTWGDAAITMYRKMAITMWEDGHYHVGIWSLPCGEKVISTWGYDHYHVGRW